MNFRKDFSIFKHRPELIYFDSAATSQKPKAVLDAMTDFYETRNANVHRGPHFLSEEATIAYAGARKIVADFIYAAEHHEIVFTRNATESINLVARSYGDAFLKEGDEVILSKLEHHSNIVPWLQLKERKGVTVKYFDVSEDGQIIFDQKLITRKTKLVAVSGMSNALGSILDVEPIIEAAHAVGAKVLIDASQLIAHRSVDVQALDADFLVFSGHKIFGPAGIGVLYAKSELLDVMPPFLGGGDMIQEVFTDHFTVAELPNKFEAGTPNIAGAVGLKAALDYVRQIGYDALEATERKLTEILLKQMSKLPYLKLVGPQDIHDRGPIVSFNMEGVHPHDVGEGLSQKHICIRAGHHCCQPLMDSRGLTATARISLSVYNTKEEIEKCVETLEEIYKYFH